MRARPLKPTTAHDPLLRFLFAEQERLNVGVNRLSDLTGISYYRLYSLRHPNGSGGKRPSVSELRRIAEALDYRFPDKLPKNGD
jgi:hypothetical protein